MSTGASLLTGFMKGLAQKKMMNEEQARADEDRKLQTDALKSKQKFETAMFEMLNAANKGQQQPRQPVQQGQGAPQQSQGLFSEMLKQSPTTQGQPAQVQSPQGQPGQGSPVQGQPQGVLDLLSNPKFLMASKFGGNDLSGIARFLQQKRGQDTALERLGVQKDSLAQRVGAEKRSDADRDATRLIAQQTADAREIETITTTKADGSTERVRMNKRTGEILGPPLSPGQGQRVKVKPRLKRLPIPSVSIPLWVHPDDLSNPQPGTTPEQAEAAGYRRITAGMKDKTVSIASAMTVLNNIDALVEKVFPETESAGERIIGGSERTLGAIAQTNPDATLLRDTLLGSLAPIIRMMGEKGALSDGDVNRAIGLLPKLTDRAVVARRKMKQIKNLIQISKNTTVGVGTGKTKSDDLKGVSTDDLFDMLKGAK